MSKRNTIDPNEADSGTQSKNNTSINTIQPLAQFSRPLASKHQISPNPVQQRKLQLQRNTQHVTSKILGHDITAPPSDPNSRNSPSKEKRSKACTNCRRSKVKCIKLNDDEVCKRCKAQHMNCVYEYKIASYKVVGSGSNSANIPKSFPDTKNNVSSTPGNYALVSVRPGLARSSSSKNGVTQEKSSLSNLLNPIEQPKRPKDSTEVIARQITIRQNDDDIQVNKNWKNTVEDRLQDFDSKLGSILNLLQEQRRDAQISNLHANINYSSASSVTNSRPCLSRGRSSGSDSDNIPEKRSIMNDAASHTSKRIKLADDDLESHGSTTTSPSRAQSPCLDENNFGTETPRGLTLNKILTKEDAQELFNFFDSNISSQLFGFNITHYRIEDIWSNCPLLVATICAIASIHHSDYSHLFVKLEALIHSLSKEILFKYPTNEIEGFNTVLALCFCGFWFQQGQMFTGLALQLAKTFNLNSMRQTSPTSKKSGISTKDRLKLWYLLYILDGQQSLVFNRQPLVNSDDPTILNPRTLLLGSPTLNVISPALSTPPDATLSIPEITEANDLEEEKNKVSKPGELSQANFSDLRLVSQVEYNQAISNVFNGEAWDLLTPASFGLPFKTNLELDKWMVQWTVLLSPFNHNPIWSSKSTLIYYNFAKMHINSRAVRELHMDGNDLPTLNDGQIEEIFEVAQENEYCSTKTKAEAAIDTVTGTTTSKCKDMDEDEFDTDDEYDEDKDAIELRKEMSPIESKKVSSELALSAAETVLNIVLNDPDILAALKYVPIHIHIMLYYAALLVLNPPSYMNTDRVKSFLDSIQSIKLVKKLRAIVKENSPIDRGFSSKLVDSLSGILSEKAISLKAEIQKDGCDPELLKTLDEEMKNDNSVISNYSTNNKKKQKLSAWPGYDHGHPSVNSKKGGK